ncbi:hypothetical protein P691DRAFT_282509 [Macrolepiota fuliginosa MF-IS2]|uniref:Uncharacterized protein n=1 Tax=Macrolepiota fuliginosa MF-IS2 TaxID=1400762 RepID=A0A9P5X7Q4_9AGAR|nr:hypothetical protein P691DRAFT_282509 [Macrolepiota fuliginosa MF-IS2]
MKAATNRRHMFSLWLDIVDPSCCHYHLPPMLPFLYHVFCCCRPRGPDVGNIDEHERLLQFQIPTTPSQPIQPKDLEYRHRMGMIVRTMEGKMVNVSSRLPFNLHNRVTHDSLGSGSRSNSLDYGGYGYYGHESDSSYGVSNTHQTRKHAQEDSYVYNHYASSRSPSLSGRERSYSTEREAERPAAILNLRLVGVTETERGRARERTTQPTGLGGGIVASPSNKLTSPNARPTDGAESVRVCPASPSVQLFKVIFPLINRRQLNNSNSTSLTRTRWSYPHGMIEPP